MALDLFIFKHPSFYSFKTRVLEGVKRLIYRVFRMDYDQAWSRLLAFRRDLLQAYCAGSAVLDVGCGRGEFLSELETEWKASRVFGIDYVTEMVRDAHSKYPEHHYCVASGMNLPFASKSLDVVTFHWVFHHIPAEDQVKLLGEAVRVARKLVFIQDTARFEVFPLYHFCRMYWRIVDGGAYYRTMGSWREFFKELNVKVIAEYPPSFIRTCIFALAAEPAQIEPVSRRMRHS